MEYSHERHDEICLPYRSDGWPKIQAAATLEESMNLKYVARGGT